jgi:hypothetical protein
MHYLPEERRAYQDRNDSARRITSELSPLNAEEAKRAREVDESRARTQRSEAAKQDELVRRVAQEVLEMAALSSSAPMKRAQIEACLSGPIDQVMGSEPNDTAEEGTAATTQLESQARGSGCRNVDAHSAHAAPATLEGEPSA